MENVELNFEEEDMLINTSNITMVILEGKVIKVGFVDGTVWKSEGENSGAIYKVLKSRMGARGWMK